MERPNALIWTAATIMLCMLAMPACTRSGRAPERTEVFPHVHLVASLLKRWLGATHQGRVGHKHLQAYPDEFGFRFNRRHSLHVGKMFHRLVGQLVLRKAPTYRDVATAQD